MILSTAAEAAQVHIYLVTLHDSSDALVHFKGFAALENAVEYFNSVKRVQREIEDYTSAQILKNLKAIATHQFKGQLSPQPLISTSRSVNFANLAISERLGAHPPFP